MQKKCSIRGMLYLFMGLAVRGGAFCPYIVSCNSLHFLWPGCPPVHGSADCPGRNAGFILGEPQPNSAPPLWGANVHFCFSEPGARLLLRVFPRKGGENGEVTDSNDCGCGVGNHNGYEIGRAHV